MFNTANNQDIVQTKLDKLFFQEFSKPNMGPGYVDVTYPIFNQMTMDKKFVQTEVNASVGLFVETPEGQAVNVDSPQIGNYVSTEALKFTQSIPVSLEMMKDGMFGAVEKNVKELARLAKTTQNRNGFAVFRNAFTTQLTPDGVSFINAAHPLIKGGTESNLLATTDIAGAPANTALTSAALDAAIQRLAVQKDQAGVLVGSAAAYLVVPPRLLRLAIQLTSSVLEGDSSTNAINVFRSDTGIRVVCSQFLDASVGGSNTAWFVMSENHGVNRYVREGLTTIMSDLTNSNNLSYRYTAYYREAYETLDYAGIIGAVGA
jgi:hypothetical protein